MLKAFLINAILFCLLIIATDARIPGKEIAEDLSPIIIVYKDGTVERLMGTEVVPPSTDPKTGVQSKDIVISPQNNITARIYIPKITSSNQRFHVLVYIHGGAFCVESPYAPEYHDYLNYLVSAANVVAVSVDYRLPPEHPLPIAFDDSWEAIKWTNLHKSGKGPEEWLNLHANFTRMYLAGDSAGANIAHHMAIRVGLDRTKDIDLAGIVLVHPYFWGTKPIGNESTDPKVREFDERLCRVQAPTVKGCDNPFINPDLDPQLKSFGCQRVLVCFAENDKLKYRQLHYRDSLLKSGWKGDVQIYGTLGEGHVFHLYDPDTEKALALLKRVTKFMN